MAETPTKRKNSKGGEEIPSVEALTLSQEEINNASEENLTPENRQGLLKILGQAIGFDITTITLPVNLNEPMSFLTRLVEGIQYSDLLEKAALCETSTQRLLYVSLFAISFYCSAERTSKPFNPLLGETYEFTDEKRGIKVITEQVSHHPPVGALHAETENWIFWQSQSLKTKFAGNSLDATVIGTSNVYLKETKEYFKWNSAKTSVHNIIMGKLWLDHYGELDVRNKTSGESAKIRMKQCGWFSAGWHELDGEVCDEKGKPNISIHGKWNDCVYGKLLNANFLPSSAPGSTPDTPEIGARGGLTKKEEKKLKDQLKKEAKLQEKERKKEQKDFKKQIKKQLTSHEPLWVHTNRAVPASQLPGGAKYMSDWTAHSLQLSEMPESLVAVLPPTDSRLRPDRMALYVGDVKKAATEKHILEERQREDRRKREAQNKTWVPKYFKLSKDSDGDDYWEYTGGYWEEKDKRIAELASK